MSGDGDPGRTKPRESIRSTASQAENFIDTANSQAGGASETFVGEFIKGHRESVVLATKYFNQRTVRKLALKENLGGCVERKADELKE